MCPILNYYMGLMFLPIVVLWKSLVCLCLYFVRVYILSDIQNHTTLNMPLPILSVEFSLLEQPFSLVLSTRCLLYNAHYIYVVLCNQAQCSEISGFCIQTAVFF